jgi:hypothetical protein
MVDKYVIYARNATLGREGYIEDYQSATFALRFNDIGTWEVVVDRRRKEAVWLSTPGWGIEAVMNLPNGTQVPLISGQIHTRKHNSGTDIETLSVTGYSDDVVFNRALAHPSPTESFPPYTITADDVRTGVASTVLAGYVNANIGPGAISPRRFPGLTIGTDPIVGATVTGRARYDLLFTLMQTLAIAGNVGFRMAQVGGGLEFQTYLPVDRSATVILSEGLGNLQAWEYTSESPETTYVYVGGDGVGTARTIVEVPDSASIITWGRRESFVDNQGTTVTAELTQAGTTYQSQHNEKTGLTITPVDINTCVYGVDYALGDRISIQLEGPIDPVSEIVREVDIALTKSGPQTLRPVIGTPSASSIYRLFRRFREDASRLDNLERH